MKIGGQTVENENRYEQLYERMYLKAKKHCGIYYLVAYLSIFLEWCVYFQIDDIWISFGASVGLIIRIVMLILFISFMWHKNPNEGIHIRSNGEITPPPLLRPWLAIIQTIICVYSLLSWLASIVPCIIYVIDYGGYIYIISLICCFVAAVGYSGIFYYLIKYFSLYRWTWAELQLPFAERMTQYRTQIRLKRQKRREARKAKWQAFRSTHFAGGESKQQKPAAKTIQTQADRRAELENLKKLYDDGLIDEEEYRRAREKTLDI